MHNSQKVPLVTLPLLAVVAGGGSEADACGRVFWNSNKQAKVVARTMDLYMSDEAQLVFYPRGTPREAASGPIRSAGKPNTPASP